MSTAFPGSSAEPVAPVGARFEGFGWRPLGRREPVFTDLDLTIEPGERVLLAGPSGSGKSTLLHALVGALGETFAGDLTGHAVVGGGAGPGGTSLHGAQRGAWGRAAKDTGGLVGLVGQNPGDAVVAGRIGRDVAFGPENLGLPRQEIWRRVDDALAAVRLAHGRRHPTDALSGGELQRLALAGALAMRPGLMLLDEPTSMLDDANAAAVRAGVLDVLEGAGTTLVVVEHRIGPWLDVVDRVVVLGHGGEIRADTDPVTFVEQWRDELGDLGVWMPGLPAPQPQPVPASLVQPDLAPEPLLVRDLGVTLVRRSLQGSVSTTALDGLRADLHPGRTHAVVGPSGAGKSTFVSVLAGLQEPSRGEAGGRHALDSLDLARHSGWVPQQPELGILAGTVAEEVALTAQQAGRDVDVEAVLEHLGLSALAEANPYRLSGGEQRRLALAAALAHRPGTVLLDEPTVGQDRSTWAAVAGWATSAAAAGALVVTATHDADLVALSDDVLRLAGPPAAKGSAGGGAGPGGASQRAAQQRAWPRATKGRDRR
ncbi:ATP-binding cassette domain-containing protein [Aeromicrobium sp. CTD01-1L150]|uniref:ATP-binding cassette domain-containing protein n=1 Tax=Aeromicrobium sp. CTD01-1L150 TaxID=3341830 RepID=UPI0035BEEEFC